MGETDVEIIRTPVKFDILTRQWNPDKEIWEGSSLKAFQSADGAMHLRGTASSTIKDLHGDTILTSALEDMERQANAGLTIFGNHSYVVPEDDYGHVESASIKQAGITDADGDPIYDLAFDIVMNDENDRAIKTWKSIQKKSKLGLSIGAMIPEGGAVRDKKSGALTISHVNLLETSIVGIPANPRSWIENAVKSLSMPTQKAASTATLGTPQLTLDTETGVYKIEGNLGDIDMGSDITFGFGKTAEPPIDESIDSPEVADAATCPDCGHGKSDGGGCQNSFHSKDAEPDVTDAKIRIIEVDTGDGGGTSSQGASDSEPASDGDVDDGSSGTEEMMASADEIITTAQAALPSLEPEVTTLLQTLLDLTKQLNRELAASVGREQEATVAKAQAERQRDEIAQIAGQLMTGTNAILNKLADQPVGRRTVFREAQRDFDGLEGVYSADFLSLLRSKKT